MAIVKPIGCEEAVRGLDVIYNGCSARSCGVSTVVEKVSGEPGVNTSLNVCCLYDSWRNFFGIFNF